MAKPVIGNNVNVKKPVLNQTVNLSNNWSFSFEYFDQIPYFGLGQTNTKWFVSLLEKLKDLSKIDVRDFERNHEVRIANRYHKIDWTSKNIPYQRSHFNWLKKEILENDEDFPFFQFQISMGLGRIIGFWDINRSFQIILLDPMHNMQPSFRYDYRVDDTTELNCELSSLLLDIEKIKNIDCQDANCLCKDEILKLPSKLNRGNFVYFVLEDDYYNELNIKTKNISLDRIIENGLLFED